jgi:uncharacterized damage-inducible protein DinB
VPTAQRIADLIDAYADGPRLLEEAVASIPEDERRFKPGPEHWSIHENVVHVTDTDLVAAGRIRYVMAQPGATLVGMDQEVWGRALDYWSQPFDEALRLLRAVRASTVPLLRRAPASAWEQSGNHTESGPMTLEWIVEHFVDHIHYHLRTIAKRRRQFAERRR